MSSGPVTVGQRLRYAAKWLVAHVLYASGALHLWKRIVLRRRAVVLMYHRVLPDPVLARTWSHPAIIVRRETFDRHMQLLRRHFNVLSLTDFEAHLSSGKPFETASCLVTFDDGWRDTYVEAWPILQKHRVPAVVFMPVRFIGAACVFWQEQLGGLLFEVWEIGQRDIEFASRAAATLEPHGLSSVLALRPESARQSVLALVQSSKYRNPATAAEAVHAIEALLGRTTATSTVDTFMDWEQAREMSALGVSFGAHSVTHRIMTTLTPDEVEEEVVGSRTVLARELDGEVSAFSYPNGDWRPDIADVVRRERFRVAFSTERGFVAPDDNPFAVRRINIHEDVTSSGPMFLARLVGAL
jgi:peptidoglycan/xylan/chitin deacetylase (PgdA/CDA1 family)